MATKGRELWEEYKRTGRTTTQGTVQRATSAQQSGIKRTKGREAWEKEKASGFKAKAAMSEDHINTFIRDANAFLESANPDYQGVNYGNSRAISDAKAGQAAELRQRGQAIAEYLDRRDDDSLAELRDWVKNFDTSADEIAGSFRSAADYYGQWKTEDDYKAYVKYQADLEEAKQGTAQKQYEAFLQSEEYKQEVEESRQRKLREAEENMMGYSSTGYTVTEDYLNSIQGESKTAQELKAKADWQAALLQQHEDSQIMARDMAEFEKWSEEEQAMLKTWIIENDREKFDLNGYYAKGQARSNADALFRKYGEQKVREMAESYTRWENEQNAEEIDSYARNAVDGKFWSSVGHSALTVGANLAGAVTAPLGYIGELTGRTGRYQTMDPNNAGNVFNQYSGAVRDQVAKNIEGENGNELRKAGSLLYQGAMSAADSAARLATGWAMTGGFGTKAASLGLAATGAFGQSMSEYSARGVEPEKAFLMSTASAGLEVATEYLPLENLMNIAKGGFKGIKKTLTDILIQAGTEVAEEEVNFISSLILEAVVLKEQSGYEQNIAQKVADGMSYQEATEAANRELVMEAAETAVVSAMSGGMSAGGGVAVGAGLKKLGQSAQARQTAKNDRALTKKIAKDIDPQKAASTLEEIEAEYGVFGETVRRAYREGQDISEFAIGFRTAYEIGRQGGSENAMKNVQYITQSQRETAYELGRTAAVQEQKWNQKSDGIAASLIGEDGSTEDVTISKIVSMNPDQMELQLADGRTVTDDQLSFSGDMEVLNKVWELGMDTESANAVLEVSRGTDLAEEVLAAGIEEGFRYGRYGYDAQRLAKTQASAQLPDAVRSAAYKAGQAYRVQLRETATVSNAENVAAGEMTVQKKGAVHFDGDRSGLTERQKVSIQALETVAEITGAEIYVEPEESELLNGENGLYNPADEKIHISLNAGDDGKGTMLYTAAHEFTHRIRHRSEAKFQALADFLVAEYVKLGVDVDALVQEQQRRYAEKGIELSYDDAFEEMVASSMEEMFTKGKAIEKMNALKKQDRTLWEEVKAFVRELAEKVRRVYEGLKPDSAEARYVRAMKEAAEELERLFAEGVMAEKTQKNTTREGGVKYSANANAYDYTKSFAQQLSDFRNGVFPERDTFVLGGTPTVLKNIGMASMPMTINQKHVGDALNGTYKGTQQEKLDHTFTAQELSTLPEKIADPIAIIYDKRTGKANASESNIDVLVEMTVASGKQVICAVQIGGNGHVNGLRIDTNKVATVHGNSDSITRLTDAINEEQNGTVAVFYVNKVKTTKVLQSAGNPIPRGLSNLDGFIHSITDPGSPVKMRISDATESQQFKRWFGDWQNHPENASKVVNADGTPKVVYHGTNKSFNVFQSQSGEYWFSEYEDYAESMMEERGGGEIKSVYLNLRNPFRAKLSPGQFTDPTYEAPIIRQAKAAGHDGVIIENDTVDPLAEDTFYVVFRPEQIKSATDNIGTFDGKNPDIRYSARNENQQTREALERQNERLREDVEELKKLLKMQGKVTGGTVFKKTSVEAAARYLKKQFDTSGDTKELAKILGSFYEYIATDRELTWEGVKEQAQAAVDWLQEHEKFHRMEYAQEILDELRRNRIALDEQQTKEAAYLYGSYGAYQKMTRGLISSGGTISLDSMWHDLAERYPGFFDPNISSSDMPQAFLDALDRLENMEDVEYSYDWQMKDMDMIRAVYDSYWRVDALYTVADKNQKKMEELRSSHRQKMEDLRKSRDQAVRKVKESHRESKERAGERKKVSEQRKKLRRTVMELDKLLNKGTKKKNVKDGMQSMVAKSLKLADALFVDEYTNRDMLRRGVGTQLTDAEEKAFREAAQLLERIESGAALSGMEFDSEIAAREYLTKLDGQLSAKMSKLNDVWARERKLLYGTTVSELLGQMADEYSRLSEAEDGAVRAAKDENVYAHLLQLQKDVGGVTVRDMSLSQMEMVADAYTMVLTTVRNANKMFAKNLKFKRDTLAGMVMSEIQGAAKKHSLLVKPWENAKDSFFWNNLKPVYAFERLGSETLRTLYQNIRKGQDVWAVDMQEADTFRREQYQKHKRKEWDLEEQHSFEFESGKVQLSLEQIMSLYAYSRREAALDHLLKGGFVFSDSTEVTQTKNGIKHRYLKKDSTAYNLSADELMQVIDTLSAEQKAFVEEMQTYLSDVMGGKGNEVSLQMYGIKSFGEKNYFPLRSAGQYMEKAKEDSFRKEQGQISIVNSGFTKATTPHASNPITLDGFMDVWAEHVNDMSMYHGFVLPMEDFRRVYNYSTPNVEEGNSQSVNAAIENAHGKAATAYIDQLYKDLNGGAVSDNRENLSKKLVGLHKKAAVFASASVVIQQPSAIVRAFALVEPRYFIGPKVDRKRHGALWTELKQYAPVAFVKEMGYFDTGMGRSAKDYLQAEEYSGIREKAAALFKDADYRDEVLGKAPALADEITWCAIWEAVKRETKNRNPKMDTKSDEFLQIAGDRFSEVIDKTQVYDSVLSRSANMRSKALHMNMLTSFMAEPTTSINMLEDALRKGNKRQIARTAGAVYGSVLLNAMLVSLVYAARDDDEDKTYWEKYLSSVAVEVLDGINPITYYPLLKDVWSAFQGYDVERADMSLIADFANAATNVTSGILKVQNASDEKRAAELSKLGDSLWGMVDSIASLTGLPLKNIRRDIEGAANLFRTISKDISSRDTTGLSLMDAVTADVMESIPIAGLLYSKSQRDRLYGAIVEGDEAYIKRLKEGYETDSAYHSALRMALRENDSRIWEAAVAWNQDDVERYIQIAKEIRGEGRFVQDDIVMAIRAEASSMEEKESASESKAKGYFTAEKFGVAIAQNNAAMADMIRDDIIATAQLNGKSPEDAEKGFQSSARSQMKELFAAGTITGSRATDLLTKYGGYTREEASRKVDEWQYEKDYPDGEVSYANYLKWENNGKPKGVSLDTYTDVSLYRQPDGSNDTKSQEEVAAYIDNLSISTEQKDALWCCFWSESTLHKKAPWHN